MDYRYFPDPDLLPLDISREWLDEVKQSMPELPHQLRERLMSDFGLSQYDATMLTTSRGVADYYLALAEQVQDKKIAANWVMGELSAALNQSEVAIENSPVSPAMLAKLISRVLDNTLNNKGAKTVFAALWAKDGDDVDQLIEKLGLKQISDTGAIEKIVDEVIANNPKNVEEFRAGKEKALNGLVGQVMKASKGKANPGQVNQILRAKLSA
jgi:aspartyl-tRNA(Asn)/glutamyl-tRNA(Gln) amidotransferase subunit B